MKIFQIVNQLPVPENIRPYMENVHSFFSDYELIIEPSIKKPMDSELFKIKYLLKYPDAMFLDWHITIDKPFDFEFSDKPYVFGGQYYWKNGCPGTAIYGNGRIDVLQKIAGEHKEGRCIHDVIYQNINLVEYFPDGYLTHNQELKCQ
jgi:hypothetical protein